MNAEGIKKMGSDQLDKEEKEALIPFQHKIEQIKEFFIQLKLKTALKIALTAILSFYLCLAFDEYLKHPEYLVSGLWTVMASIVVLQGNIGGTYKAIWNRFCGVLIGSAVGAFFVFEFGSDAAVMGIAIFLTIVLCTIFKIPESYRIAALSVVIIILPLKLHPTNDPWTFAFFRFLDTCLGFIVAILVTNLLWPSKALTQMRMNIAETSILLQRYFEHLLIPERSLKVTQALTEEIDEALRKSREVLEESKVELLISFAPAGIWIDLMNCQERMWESLRVLESILDPSLDEVFDDEMKLLIGRIIEGIDLALEDCSQDLKTGQSKFDYSLIAQLESSIVEQKVRFRAAGTLKKYPLEIVEGYFVFFYQIRQLLASIHTLHQLLVQLKDNPVESGED